ncbi:50S ribosomal protein L18 [Ruminiclostridium cellobioparum]|jgi:large subunit ribosomal protein L18|uniref:Large ribosomal subunit protein uL18 n=1 Tax=Ruminiclostridium cellobioparum subsp. termitidis CT1112 TaxID=1195236 RepID=S0FS69_RUMCE|nr:50S ribosomal protein L18 [Ruminiclostridium cellobioparum]EMS71318.1 ribosomal protein L18, bacterial type [Ruminiclostridium cellobioparum subsp. termitidis CT1112]
MIKKPNRNDIRLRKHVRVRKKVAGTQERPRMNVFRSLKNIYVQIIDDSTGNTLVSASTLDAALKGKVANSGNKEAAKEVGKLIATKAIEKGIKQVVFDRGGYIYHGRVKELADAAREAGLDF